MLLVSAAAGLYRLAHVYLEPSLVGMGIPLVNAFFSSVPEISVSFFASNSSSLGMMFGSIFLTFTLIPFVLILQTPGYKIELESGPLIRDCLSFLASFLLFLAFVWDGEISGVESVILVLSFFLYAWFVYLTNPGEESKSLGQQQSNVKKPSLGSRHSHDASGDNAAVAAGRGVNNDHHHHNYGTMAMGKTDDSKSSLPTPVTGSSSSEANEVVVDPELITPEMKSIWSDLILVLEYPSRILLFSTFMCFGFGMSHASQMEEIKRRPVMGLFLLLIWLVVLSFSCLYFSSVLAHVAGISHFATGISLISLLVQVPGTVTSVWLIRGQNADFAMNNFISSLIMEVLFGLGASSLVYFFFAEQEVKYNVRNHQSIIFLASALAVMYCLLFIALSHRLYRWRYVFGNPRETTNRPRKAVLDLGSSLLLVLAYAGGLLLCVTNQVVPWP